MFTGYRGGLIGKTVSSGNGIIVIAIERAVQIMLRVTFKASAPVIIIVPRPKHVAAAQHIGLGAGQLASRREVSTCRRGISRWQTWHGIAVVIVEA